MSWPIFLPISLPTIVERRQWKDNLKTTLSEKNSFLEGVSG